jgi:hypothetical protein
VSLLGRLKALLGGQAGSGSGENDVRGGWTIAKIARNGALHGVVRIRGQRPALPPGKRFGHSVRVSWKYAESGLPSSTAARAMTRFEDALEELTDANGHAFLMRVRTGFGAREWLFYTEETAPFMARFNQLLRGHAAYPLEVLFAEDPQWEDWQASLNEMGTPSRQ